MNYLAFYPEKYNFSKYSKCKLIFSDILSVHCCTVSFLRYVKGHCVPLLDRRQEMREKRGRMQQRSLAGLELGMMQFMLWRLNP